MQDYQNMVLKIAQMGWTHFFHKLLHSAKARFGNEITAKLLQPDTLINALYGGTEMLKELLSFKEIDVSQIRVYNNCTILYMATFFKYKYIDP